MSQPGAVERATAALRAGRPLAMGEWRLLAVETATPSILELLDPGGEARLLLSGARGAALGLGYAREAADPAKPVLLERSAWLGQAEALALVDPARDFDRPPLGPLRPVAPGSARDQAAQRDALTVARLAGLLPALWLLPAGAELADGFDANALYGPPAALLVARAKLPIEGISDVQLAVFRDSASGEEHVALLIGAFAGRPPLVRLHSECLTGDVFGSLKCDCGPQLREALRLIDQEGGGILLYLRQEGRGIGLANKIRAYQLQDRGLDTVDANRRLGFADDERDYAMAGEMLRALGVDRIRLLTNNPAKVEGIEAAGIGVVERVAHHMPANPHNLEYLATKKARSGHLD